MGSTLSRPHHNLLQTAGRSLRLMAARPIGNGSRCLPVSPLWEESLVLPTGSSRPSSSRLAYLTESSSHSHRSAVARQVVTARSRSHDDRQAHLASQASVDPAGGRDQRVSRVPSSESGYLQDIRCALHTRGCPGTPINQLSPGARAVRMPAAREMRPTGSRWHAA